MDQLNQYHLLLGYALLFVAVGVGFIFVHLLAGKFIRPSKPEAEKLTIYECGEPTIGSAWIQFDLRFYVVALLFVIFDVEVAFFFPWAVVFGTANQLGQLPDLVKPQQPRDPGSRGTDEERANYEKRFADYKDVLLPRYEKDLALRRELTTTLVPASSMKEAEADEHIEPKAARQLALLAFIDIAVFFGVLLVGFAYLWRRGDLDWVRTVAAQHAAQPPPALSNGASRPEGELMAGVR